MGRRALTGCVILAQLDMTLTTGGEVDGDVTVVDEMRPILLHSRLLQEWLMCGHRAGQSELSHTFATLSAPNETTIRAWLPAGFLRSRIPLGGLCKSRAQRGVVSGLWPEIHCLARIKSRRSLDAIPFAETSFTPTWL